VGLYLCYNCASAEHPMGKPFEADLPVCACGVDGRVPEMAAYIAKREVIHFDPPHDILKGRGKRKHACSDEAVGRGPMAAGHPAAVTCAKCTATEVYREACAKFGEPVPEAKGDFTVG